MVNQGWAYTGAAAEEVLESEIRNQDMRREEAAKTRRFWIKEIGPSRCITFVDGVKHPKGYDLPFNFMEHGLKLFVGGREKWMQLTCLGKGCPLCASGNSPYLARAYTIIDHSEYTARDGKVHKNELRLFVAKPTVQRILKKYVEKKKSLRGWKVDVSRNGPQSASTGDQFIEDAQTELDPTIQPVDYFDVFKPKSLDDINKILSGVNPDYERDYNASSETPVDVDTDETVRF